MRWFPDQISSARRGTARRRVRPALEVLEARCVPVVAITEFALPTPDSRPWGITVGPEGNLWFTESGSRRIGRMTVGGAVTGEFGVRSGSPRNITVGPDSNLWFSESL